MKKIGILFGRERSFPHALIERINAFNDPDVIAEPVTINKVAQGEPSSYAVILDRISQDVPLYRAYLKNAALNGTAVVNNPFWWSADDKFFNNSLATKVGVAVPPTVILPSKEHPDNCTAETFSNLAYPLDWDAIFRYVGWPAYFKAYAGTGWKNVYRVADEEEFYRAYAQTGQLLMMLQSEVQYEEYYRCYCLGGTEVRVMPYAPHAEHHQRYVTDRPAPAAALLERMQRDALALNQALGYDVNTVEFGVSQGLPYAIDFCNPAPESDRATLGEEHFAWIVETTATFLVRRARAHLDGQSNLTWGRFVQSSAAGKSLGAPSRKK